MLGFLQLSKPIKWQDLLEKGKNGRNAFRTGAKIHFSKKKIMVMGTLMSKRNVYILKCGLKTKWRRDPHTYLENLSNCVL